MCAFHDPDAELVDQTLRGVSEKYAKLRKELLEERKQSARLADRSGISDQTYAEDILNSNRSSKVIEDYEFFKARERKHFVRTLEGYRYSAEDGNVLACRLFKTVYDGAIDKFKIEEENLKKHLRKCASISSTDTKEGDRLTQSVNCAIQDIKTTFWQNTADFYNIGDIVQKVQEDVRQNRQNRQLFDQLNRNGWTFITSCARLCWRMVVQTPPLEIECERGVGHSVDTSKQEIFESRLIRPNLHGVVTGYYWPYLYRTREGTQQEIIEVMGIVRLGNPASVNNTHNTKINHNR